MLKNTKKIKIFAQIFCARVKQICRFVYANISGFDIHWNVHAVCMFGNWEFSAEISDNSDDKKYDF